MDILDDDVVVNVDIVVSVGLRGSCAVLAVLVVDGCGPPRCLEKSRMSSARLIWNTELVKFDPTVAAC